MQKREMIKVCPITLLEIWSVLHIRRVNGNEQIHSTRCLTHKKKICFIWKRDAETSYTRKHTYTHNISHNQMPEGKLSLTVPMPWWLIHASAFEESSYLHTY